MNKDQSKIPQATAKRLPLYYRFLKNLHASENSVYHPLNSVMP